MVILNLYVFFVKEMDVVIALKNAISVSKMCVLNVV